MVDLVLNQATCSQCGQPAGRCTCRKPDSLMFQQYEDVQNIDRSDRLEELDIDWVANSAFAQKADNTTTQNQDDADLLIPPEV